MISTTVRHAALITNESVTQHQVRTALDQLTEDLREATVVLELGHLAVRDDRRRDVAAPRSPSTRPTTTYSTADQTDYHLREISYQLSGGNFQRTSVASSNTGGPPWTIPALGTLGDARDRGVVNSAVFTYYDGSQPPVATTEPGGGAHRRRHGHRQRARHRPPVQLLGHARPCGRHRRHEAPAPQASRRVGPDDDARRLRDRARLDARGRAHRPRDERGPVERPGRLERLRLPGRRGRDRQLRLEAPRRPPLLPPLRRRRRVDPGRREHHRRGRARRGRANITWTYPFGQDNWKVLGNGYAYNLEITAPSGSATPQQEAIQIVSTGCRWDSTLRPVRLGREHARSARSRRCSSPRRSRTSR